MNCQQCLAELATGSLRDLQPESAVMQHCATCPDCGPLATLLRDREYNAATILNNLLPLSNPIMVAETAGLMSRRRRVGKVVVFLTGAALVATIVTSLFVTDLGRHMVGANDPALFTETIPLTCLSSQQAAELINPYVRANHSVYYPSTTGFSMITVRSTAEEIAKAKAVIREFESSPRARCRFTIGDQLMEAQKQLNEAFGTGGPKGPGPTPDAAPKASGPTK